MNLQHFEDRIPIFKDLGFREDGIPQLRDYIDILWSANEEMNLISRKMTYEELIDNHVIDCMLPLKKFPKDIVAAADFGSGGGLPGIIFAIQFPDIHFHLFEKSKLKQKFLNHCAELAPNIKVQAEVPIHLKSIDLVTARAFKPIDVILDVSRSYYDKGGKYFLLKARLEKIEEELIPARKKFKNLKVEIEPLTSPVLVVERHLVRLSS